MTITVTATVERFNVAGDFTIARGAQSFVDLVVCEVSDGTHTGRAEATPIYFEGETAELCADAIMMRSKQNRAITRDDLLNTMMEGAARNAFDCALWDLEAKQAGKPLWQLAGLAEPKPVTTAITISLDDPDAMAKAAMAAVAKGYGLLKLKLDAEDSALRVAAVRKAAPKARLIVDANESWGELDLERQFAAMAALGVEMIEQPIEAGEEDLLDDMDSPVPICADESCHTVDDIERLGENFQAVNIKLDKAGGLTSALQLAAAAKERGLDIMLGCMLSTSLGIRPALALAPLAKWVDLDGPALLAKDRKGGLVYKDGLILPD